MPNRIVREGILSSERVNELSWEEEVFYRRLLSVADDFGRYTAHPSLLRAALYPLKLETVREASMERHLAACEKARLIRLYEVGSKQYLVVHDFGQQQRAMNSKYPEPPPLSPGVADAQQPTDTSAPRAKHVDSTCIARGEHVRTKTEAEAEAQSETKAHTEPPPSGGGARPGRKPASEPASTPFELFWAAWPSHHRKRDRGKAEARWTSKRLDSEVVRIVQHVEACKRSVEWTKDQGRYIPAPLVYLNQGTFDAPPPPPADGTPGDDDVDLLGGLGPRREWSDEELNEFGERLNQRKKDDEQRRG